MQLWFDDNVSLQHRHCRSTFFILSVSPASPPSPPDVLPPAAGLYNSSSFSSRRVFYADKADLQTSDMMVRKQAVSDSALWGKHPLWIQRNTQNSALHQSTSCFHMKVVSVRESVKAASAASGVSSPASISFICLRSAAQIVSFKHDEQPIGAFHSSNHLTFIASLRGEQRRSSFLYKSSSLIICVTRVIQSKSQTNQVAFPPQVTASQWLGQ